MIRLALAVAVVVGGVSGVAWVASYLPEVVEFCDQVLDHTDAELEFEAGQS